MVSDNVEGYGSSRLTQRPLLSLHGHLCTAERDQHQGTWLLRQLARSLPWVIDEDGNRLFIVSEFLRMKVEKRDIRERVMLKTNIRTSVSDFNPYAIKLYSILDQLLETGK